MAETLPSRALQRTTREWQRRLLLGVLAGLVDGLAEVSLRAPVPLDRALDVVARAGRLGARARRRRGDRRRASGAPSSTSRFPAGEPRRRARRGGRLPRLGGLGLRPMFDCGPAREGVRVFAGAVAGRQVVASPWTPPAWTADAAGHVLPEFVWAVLDCPTYFGALHGRRASAQHARAIQRADRRADRRRRGARRDRMADRSRPQALRGRPCCDGRRGPAVVRALLSRRHALSGWCPARPLADPRPRERQPPSHARTTSATWRWSVPQQPPSSCTRGSCSRSAVVARRARRDRPRRAPRPRRARRG